MSFLFHLKIYMNLYGDLIWCYKVLELEFQSTVRPLIIKHNCFPLLLPNYQPPSILPQQPFFAQREKIMTKNIFFRLEKNFEIEIKIKIFEEIICEKFSKNIRE